MGTMESFFFMLLLGVLLGWITTAMHRPSQKQQAAEVPQATAPEQFSLPNREPPTSIGSVFFYQDARMVCIGVQWSEDQWNVISEYRDFQGVFHAHGMREATFRMQCDVEAAKMAADANRV